jgi:hypothetical protein
MNELLVIIALALCPILFEVMDGRLAVNLSLAFRSVLSWFAGLVDGTAWTFVNGSTTWDFLAVVPKFALVTLAYLEIPGSLGLIGGFVLGLARDPRRDGEGTGLVDAATNVVFAIPDFILSVIVQLAVIPVLDATGLKLFSISYDPRSGAFLALPLLGSGLHDMLQKLDRVFY